MHSQRTIHRHWRTINTKKWPRLPLPRTVPFSPSGGAGESTKGRERRRLQKRTFWWHLDLVFYVARSVLESLWGERLLLLGDICLGLEQLNGQAELDSGPGGYRCRVPLMDEGRGGGGHQRRLVTSPPSWLSPAPAQLRSPPGRAGALQVALPGPTPP